MQIINPAVRRAAELFTDGVITDNVLTSVAAMRGLPLYVERDAVPETYTQDIVWESADTLRASIAEAEQMAAQSKRYAERDPHAINGAITAQRRVEHLKSRLSRLITGDKGTAPDMAEILRMSGLAGEIMQVAMLFRVGAADGLTQQAAFRKFAEIARRVGKKEFTLQEVYDQADGAGGVPYHGEAA